MSFHNGAGIFVTKVINNSPLKLPGREGKTQFREDIDVSWPLSSTVKDQLTLITSSGNL